MVVLLDKEVRPELATVMSYWGVAVHAIRTFDISGKDVLISASGTMGILAVLVAEYSGAKSITLIDKNIYNLERAKLCVPNITISSLDGGEKLENIRNNQGIVQGYDVGIELCGSKLTINDMVRNMKKQGEIAILGTNDSEESLDWECISWNCITLRGISGRRIFEDWYTMKDMLEQNIEWRGIIIDSFLYTDYELAINRMTDLSCGRVILRWI